jgi:hypothetical protein
MQKSIGSLEPAPLLLDIEELESMEAPDFWGGFTAGLGLGAAAAGGYAAGVGIAIALT